MSTAMHLSFPYAAVLKYHKSYMTIPLNNTVSYSLSYFYTNTDIHEYIHNYIHVNIQHIT